MRLCGALGVLCFCVVTMKAQPAGTDPSPTREILQFYIEWRLIHAGTATLTLTPPVSPRRQSQATLHLESAGLISKLFKVDDNYSVNLEEQFCAASSLLHAQEGKRNRETKITYDHGAHKAFYLERDLLNNQVVRSDNVEIPPCVHDVLGALQALRNMTVDVGHSVQLPISDGKKSVLARVEAREREDLRVRSGLYKTVRYEAFLFNGVLYNRKAQLFVWLTDDARKLPVQVRVRMQFTIGTITLELEKEDHS